MHTKLRFPAAAVLFLLSAALEIYYFLTGQGAILNIISPLVVGIIVLLRPRNMRLALPLFLPLCVYLWQFTYDLIIFGRFDLRDLLPAIGIVLTLFLAILSPPKFNAAKHIWLIPVVVFLAYFFSATYRFFSAGLFISNLVILSLLTTASWILLLHWIAFPYPREETLCEEKPEQMDEKKSEQISFWEKSKPKLRFLYFVCIIAGSAVFYTAALDNKEHASLFAVFIGIFIVSTVLFVYGFGIAKATMPSLSPDVITTKNSRSSLQRGISVVLLLAFAVTFGLCMYYAIYMTLTNYKYIGSACSHLCLCTLSLFVLHWGISLLVKSFRHACVPIETLYEDCAKARIKSISNPTQFERAKIIAHKLNAEWSDEEIRRVFEKGKEVTEGKKKEQVRLKKIEENNQLRIEELKLRDELERYRYYTGREKRIKMLHEEFLSAQKKYFDLAKTVDGIERGALLEKERDWAAWGGFAEGIAGPAAGLAVALDTQRENAEIRAYNDKMRNVSAHALILMQPELAKLEEAVLKAKKKVEKAALLLVGSETSAEAFSALNFTKQEVSVTPTGAVKISVSTVLKEPISVVGKKAVVDGSIKVNIFDKNSTLVGTAFLTLPLYGVGGRACNLAGICTTLSNPKGEYTISLEPHNMWVIER